MKTVVVKLSGKSIDNFNSSQSGIKLINKLKHEYTNIVFVHGGGKLISDWSAKFGIEAKFVDGQRVTDKQTIDVVAAVQSGLINSKITAFLNSNNIRALGLNGIDGNIFVANQTNDKLGFVGEPKQQNSVFWLFQLMKEGITPVFSSLCRDSNGELVNVNADLFTSEIAKAVDAETVLFFSDVDGIMLNGEYQNLVTQKDIMNGIASKEITDGMIPKITSCMYLLNYGISKIWIGKELDDLANNKRGTWIVSSEKIAV